MGDLMRITTLTIAVATAVILLAGCGGPSEEEKTAATDARKLADQREKDAAKATTLAETCHSQLGDYLKVLTETGSRLDVGMSFADYGEQVGDIAVAYDRLPIGKMDTGCTLGPGLPAESAGQAYTKAYDEWNDCISDFGCDVDSIDPSLQDYWTRANRQTLEARYQFTTLDQEAAEAKEDAEEQEKKATEAEAALE
jgi:hypothetical protein